jgi:hypothetical protein
MREAIRRMHGADATHVESVPVKETFRGETVWDGVVEVFDLHGHPTASRVYAWAHDTDDPHKPRRQVTVLQLSHRISTACGESRDRGGVQDQ